MQVPVNLTFSTVRQSWKPLVTATPGNLHAESACNHLRGYAGQDLCHVVYAKVLHVVSHTLYSRDLYGFWSAQYHLKQWVGLQAPEQCW